MAKAPELLNTLKEVLDAWHYGDILNVGEGEEIYERAVTLVNELDDVQIRAVLEKARGES
jgi:hypothetical protein